MKTIRLLFSFIIGEMFAYVILGLIPLAAYLITILF